MTDPSGDTVIDLLLKHRDENTIQLARAIGLDLSIEPPVPDPINPDWLDEPETGEEEEE